MKTLAPLSTLALAGLAALGAAQASPTLYTPGRPVADQKIRLRSWGSGIISETEEAAYEGTTSIRIASKNFFQGGTLVYENPISLANSYGDRSNLLRIVFRPLDAVTGIGGGRGGARGGGLPGGAGGGDEGDPGAGGRGGGFGAGGRGGGIPGGPGGPGGIPGGLGGRGRGQGGPGGIPGGPGGLPGGPGGASGFPGGPGGRGGATASARPSLRTVRLVITTTDDLKSEAYVPVATSISAQDGWRQVGIPLKAIRGFDRTNKTIKEITVSGDSSGAFYLGDLRVVNDPTPIRAEPTERNVTLALNDIKTLTVRGEGGSSVLRYTWDFDDSDGIGIDAEGPTVQHKFRKPGTFTVTITVQDEYGLKDPYTTTIKVKVNG